MNLKDHFPNAAGDFVKANPAIFGDMGNDLALGRGPTSKNDVQPIVATKRRGSMNKTEAEFAMILHARKAKGEIREWRFESVKLRLGDGCWYIPDFFIEPVNAGSQPYFIEVKGFMREDARVKFLTAKEIHSWASFEMWRKVKGQGWTQIL